MAKPRKLNSKEITKMIDSYGVEFPLYPPKDGDTQIIRIEEDTFTVIEKGTKDLCGLVDEKFDNVQIAVYDVMNERDRTYSCKIFSDVPKAMLKLVKENGGDPEHMKGTTFTITNMGSFQYDVEINEE